MLRNETIAAIATAMTNAGISVIRVSGPDAFAVTDRIFRSPKKDFRLSDQKGYTAHYGHIVDGDEFVDEVLVLVMRAPHSLPFEEGSSWPRRESAVRSARPKALNSASI